MSESEPISPTSASQSFLASGESFFSPGLYVVATPIGNLRDITLRALDVLRSADRILAEDTRQTRKLLSAYDIDTPLTAYHDHNVAKMLPKVMDWLSSGEVIAQVSDAGTPLVSDPGFKLVRAVIEQGHNVIPLPGASAPLAALVAAGLPTDRFLFEGFLPSKTTARKTALGELSNIKASLIFFESGHRVFDSLSDMQTVLGDRPAVIARELTKKYEEIRRGRLSELMVSVKDDPPRGEIVVLVAPPQGEAHWDEKAVDEELKVRLPELGAKRASAEIAELSGWAKRDVYQRALKLKSDG